MRKTLTLLAPMALLAGCMSGPDYAGPPQLATAAGNAFVRAGPEIDPLAPIAGDWWTLLGDPVLNELEARALAGNPGVAAARARIEQARASVRQERANRLPAVAAQATAVQANIPGLDIGSGPPPGSPGAPADTEEQDSLSVYNLGLNANWEIDFAGGQARRVEAINAQAAASVANAEDAKVQLAAEVARAYVSLREAQGRLELVERERNCSSRFSN